MEIEDLQRNFEGYLNTSLLWKNSEVYDLKQYVLQPQRVQKFEEKVAHNLRLGKLVERFVSHHLTADDSIEILSENIQIQDARITIGELDALLMTTDGPVHLEIIYKFYLYDPDLEESELSHWIGPNRKDSLLQKLDKLKNKQLPLLYHPKTQSYLENLGLDVTKITQKVLFKAQLFLPLQQKELSFPKMNPECVQGFYIKCTELDLFEDCQFYIPEKMNWLMQVHVDVKWLDHQIFSQDVSVWLNKKLSPLSWMKQDGKLHKFFVVWW